MPADTSSIAYMPDTVKLSKLPVVKPMTRKRLMKPPVASRSPSSTHSPDAIMKLEPSHPFKEEHERPVLEGEGQHGGHPAAEVAKVPEEESQRDESGGTEEGTRVVLHGADFGREDGEEHGDGKSEGHAEGQPAELAEEMPHGGGLSGGALGVLDAGHGLGKVLDHAALDEAVVPPNQGDEGDEGGHGHNNGSQEVEKGGGLAFAGRATGGRRHMLGREQEHGDDLGHGG
ncbi:uncharacterized protein TCAP_02167 [Tolypocladium capitatum]|uniref:Uncharacterized protein n=1 Tax=Tolypocladium capitatum TaxID=45235 RepID=A0A2K3QK84_9HYPO|nr:uncharacterized protein TCAP_02167 [Tolypocladium capitatum]